ncbi:MAG: hypothetical protein JSW41_01625 [Candidatus Aenigmatarchaeota archaeon]|nr:MAG: hypothetical protein JSW41_01625 [Candidatus Aenigmarchaeota archaeon]
MLEGPQDAKTRSESPTGEIYEASDGRNYVVAILSGFKDPKTRVHYQEEPVAIFGTKEYLESVEVGDFIQETD